MNTKSICHLRFHKKYIVCEFHFGFHFHKLLILVHWMERCRNWARREKDTARRIYFLWFIAYVLIYCVRSTQSVYFAFHSLHLVLLVGAETKWLIKHRISIINGVLIWLWIPVCVKWNKWFKFFVFLAWVKWFSVELCVIEMEALMGEIDGFCFHFMQFLLVVKWNTRRCCSRSVWAGLSSTTDWIMSNHVDCCPWKTWLVRVRPARNPDSIKSTKTLSNEASSKRDFLHLFLLRVTLKILFLQKPNSNFYKKFLQNLKVSKKEVALTRNQQNWKSISQLFRYESLVSFIFSPLRIPTDHNE